MRVYIHVYVEVYDCIVYKYYETMLNGPNLNLFIKKNTFSPSLDYRFSDVF
jgi:hypothetical protein